MSVRQKQRAIRLGVIGAAAAVERLHWPVLKRMSRQIQVVGIASRTRARAEQCAGLMGGIRVYDDYRRLLGDPAVDAVLIAVPIEVCAAVTIDAVNSGKHVMAEKPLAATPEEGLQVLRACSKTSRVVAIGEDFRYRKDVTKARELLRAGTVGEIFAFQARMRFDLDAQVHRVWAEKQWRRDARHPGGYLLDAGVHPVAALRDLLGEVTELCAYTLDRHPVIGGPDSLLLQLKLDTGAIGHCFICYTAKAEEEMLLELIAYGGRGTIEIRDGTVKWAHGCGRRGGVFRYGKQERGYWRQWQNFCRAICGEEELVSTPERAYGDLLVIDAGLRSARVGQKVVLQPAIHQRGL